MGDHKYPVIDKVEGENPWITYMKYQVYQKNNCINGIATGKPGSGKSWSMLSMAQQLDPDFKLEGNLFFNAAELFRAIRDSDNKPGKLWLFDEAGIDLNNLKYFDEVNKGFNAFFQTGRHRNYIFMMSVPYMNFISKGVRTLMTTAFRADGWNADNKTILIPRSIEYNGDMDKFYRKRLLVRDGSMLQLCNKIHMKRPSKKIVNEYEILKREFTGDLFGDIADKIQAFEDKQVEKAKVVLLTIKQQEILTALEQGKTVPMIAEERGIAEKVVYSHMMSMRKRGFEFKGQRDDNKKITRYLIADPRKPNSIG